MHFQHGKKETKQPAKEIKTKKIKVARQFFFVFVLFRRCNCDKKNKNKKGFFMNWYKETWHENSRTIDIKN